MPGVRRMIKRLPKSASVRVFVNPVPLLERLEKPSPNSPGEIALKILAPEDVQAGVIDLSWERDALSVRATIALADDCQGIARILARPTNSARVFGVFPEDFAALGRIGWGSASGLIDGAYAISDRFDETISAEYREELAEFRKETGVDWDTGILGNLVGELAFGVRVDFTRKNPIGWAVVSPLADAAAFREQVETLIEHFELTLTETEHEGVTVRTAVGTVPFSFAVGHGLLIIADGAETVADVVNQSAKGKKAEPAGANLRACYAALGDPNHLAVMLDIERLRQQVPILPMAVGPKFAPLFAQGSVGLAMTVEDQVARVDFRWTLRSAGARERKHQQSAMADLEGSDVMVTLATALAKSIARARLLSKRTVSMHNMQGIGQALYLYADKHKGAFPEGLDALLRADTLSLKALTSPYTGRGPESIDEVDRKSYLVYRPGLTTASHPMEVLLAEREVHEGGASFLFVDGHVEFILEPRASELLELMAEGAEEIRR